METIPEQQLRTEHLLAKHHLAYFKSTMAAIAQGLVERPTMQGISDHAVAEGTLEGILESADTALLLGLSQGYLAHELATQAGRNRIGEYIVSEVHSACPTPTP